jgi:hypothetical protein
MRLGEALKDEFLTSGLVDADRFDSQVTDADIEPVYSETDTGLKVCTLDYTANYYCERLPNKFDARLIVLLVSLFLINNDSNRGDRELANPDIQIDDIGDGHVSITISIEFSEDVFVNKDVNGKIIIDGEKYSLGERDALAATGFSMTAEIKPGQ